MKRGLCIGGPLDGLFKEGEHTLVAPIPEPLPSVTVYPPATPPPAVMPALKRAIYQFHLWYSDDAPEGRGFWALEDMKPADIMDALIERYRRNRG